MPRGMTLEEERWLVNSHTCANEMVGDTCRVCFLANKLAEVERERDDEIKAARSRWFALAAEQAENARLRRFCDSCWDAARDGCDVEGGDVQEWLVACGFLVGHKRTEACGENCRCAEYFGTDEPWTCYEPVPPSSNAALREVCRRVAMKGLKSGRVVMDDGTYVPLEDQAAQIVDAILGPEVTR